MTHPSKKSAISLVLSRSLTNQKTTQAFCAAIAEMATAVEPLLEHLTFRAVPGQMPSVDLRKHD